MGIHLLRIPSKIDVFASAIWICACIFLIEIIEIIEISEEAVLQKLFPMLVIIPPISAEICAFKGIGMFIYSLML